MGSNNKAMFTANHQDSQVVVETQAVQPRRSAMSQAIPDLLVRMMDVSEDSVQCVRKTAEVPPRVSIYDVIGLITGYAPEHRSQIWYRLCDQFPEVNTIGVNFRFPGRGQRDTPVADAEGIVTIIMLLPGRAAAVARQSAANVLVRYLGGDLSLVREVMHNHNMRCTTHHQCVWGELNIICVIWHVKEPDFVVMQLVVARIPAHTRSLWQIAEQPQLSHQRDTISSLAAAVLGRRKSWCHSAVLHTEPPNVPADHTGSRSTWG